MVLDHTEKELAIELGASCLIEIGHFLVGQHSGHQHVVFHAVHFHLHARGFCIGRRQAAIAQPLLHRPDFVGLADNNPFAQDGDILARAMRRSPACHDDRLRVMRNHASHEVNVSVTIGLRDSHGPLLGRGLVDQFLLITRVCLAAAHHRVAAAHSHSHSNQPCCDALRKHASHRFLFSYIVHITTELRRAACK